MKRPISGIMRPARNSDLITDKVHWNSLISASNSNLDSLYRCVVRRASAVYRASAGTERKETTQQSGI